MSSTGRERALEVSIYSQPRSLGVLPTALHSDAHTLVLSLLRESNQRGRQVSLPPEREAAVDAALKGGGVFHGGIAQLAQRIDEWRRAVRADGGTCEVINTYYDAWRAKGYTAATRSVFIVDEEGKITYKWLAPNPGIEPNYDEIKAALG